MPILTPSSWRFNYGLSCVIFGLQRLCNVPEGVLHFMQNILGLGDRNWENRQIYLVGFTNSSAGCQYMVPKMK